MKPVAKLSLVAIFALGLLVIEIGAAQAAMHHRHHIFACPGKPGTIAALLCPAKK